MFSDARVILKVLGFEKSGHLSNLERVPPIMISHLGAVVLFHRQQPATKSLVLKFELSRQSEVLEHPQGGFEGVHILHLEVGEAEHLKSQLQRGGRLKLGKLLRLGNAGRGVVGHDVESHLASSLRLFDLLKFGHIFQAVARKHTEGLHKDFVVVCKASDLFVDQCDDSNNVVVTVPQGHTQHGPKRLNQFQLKSKFWYKPVHEMSITVEVVIQPFIVGNFTDVHSFPPFRYQADDLRVLEESVLIRLCSHPKVLI